MACASVFSMEVQLVAPGHCLPPPRTPLTSLNFFRVFSPPRRSRSASWFRSDRDAGAAKGHPCPIVAGSEAGGPSPSFFAVLVREGRRLWDSACLDFELVAAPSAPGREDSAPILMNAPSRWTAYPFSRRGGISFGPPPPFCMLTFDIGRYRGPDCLFSL